MNKNLLMMIIIILLLMYPIVSAKDVRPTSLIYFNGWLYGVGQPAYPEEFHDLGPYYANRYVVDFEWVVPWPSYDGVWLLVQILDMNKEKVLGEALFNQYYQDTFYFFNLEDFGHYLRIVYYYWNGSGEAPEVYYDGFAGY